MGQLRSVIPGPRAMRVLAVSRRRVASARDGLAPPRSAPQAPASCDPEVDQAEVYKRRHALRQQRSWLEKLNWQAAAGALAGASPSSGGLVGAELRAGLRGKISLGGGAGFLGDWLGLDVRARWLMAPDAAHPQRFTVGLWPWMMMSDDWVFHRHFVRQPTFMNVLVPEAGFVFSRGVGGYLGWSFPIMLRPTIFFYRNSPYLLDEHWAFEFTPGVLWLFEPSGQSVTFTLSLSAGLW